MFTIIRGIILLTVSVIGVIVGFTLIDSNSVYKEVFGDNTSIKLAFLLGSIFYLITSMLLREINKIIDDFLENLSLKRILLGTFGFIVGAILANVILLVPLIIFFNSDIFKHQILLKKLEPLLKIVIPITINMFVGYIGYRIMTKYDDDIISVLSGREYKQLVSILDTSAIIDGRIFDICKTGILSGEIIIPKFVLNELQFIADSSDSLKRQKGRRGLDILHKLKTEITGLVVRFTNDEIPDEAHVDNKLLILCNNFGAKLITNDYNLNKIAKLKGIQVINVNELANAMKPTMVSGEKLMVKIIKKGKDIEQGIGYLDDGTMIVVEDGGNHVGKEMKTTVKSVLQTSAGRIIFTRCKMN